MWIAKLALKEPYTIVVLAILIHPFMSRLLALTF
jgi:hypothetical protein